MERSISYSKKSLAPWIQAPLNVRASRNRCYFVAGVHGVGFFIACLFLIVLLPLESDNWQAWLKLLLCVASLFNIGHSALGHIEQYNRGRGEVNRLIELHYDGIYWHLTWMLSPTEVDFHRAKLIRSASVTYRKIMFLTFETLNGKTVRIDLWQDQLSAQEYRRLYVVLNWADV